jgi:hypothetical protein
VGVVGKTHKGGGSVGTGDGPGVHFAKDHAGGFNEAEGCVYGEEFAGRARAEGVSIVHAETIRYPIEIISRELCELIGPVGCRGKGFLQLIIRSPVIPANPETTILDINVFGGVMGGFANDVGAGGRRRFGLSIEATGKHLGGPSRENGDGPRAPFRDRNADMFPIWFKI